MRLGNVKLARFKTFLKQEIPPQIKTHPALELQGVSVTKGGGTPLDLQDKQ
jgi:hypothetical protein